MSTIPEEWPLSIKPGNKARIVLASQGVRLWTADCSLEAIGETFLLSCSDPTTLDNLRRQQRVAFTILNDNGTIQGSGMAKLANPSSHESDIIVEPYRVTHGDEIWESRLKGWTKVTDTAPPDISRYAFWHQAFRLVTLPLSALPVLVGGAAAFAQEHLNLPLLVLSLVGAVAAHAGANAAADYFDFKKGVDSSKALSSHLGALARERVNPEMILLAAFGCFLVTALCGLALLQAVGWKILVFGLVGLVGAFSYTGKPFAYKYHALGELMLGILVGPVIVMGTYFVQTRGWDWPVFLLSVGLGMLISSVSLVNNLRDMPDDRAAGILTLPMLLGVSKTKSLYYFLTWGPYLATAAAVIIDRSFWPVALALISLPLAIRATKALSETGDDIGQIRLKSQTNPYPLNSIRLHARFGTMLVIGLVVAGVLRLISG